MREGLIEGAAELSSVSHGADFGLEDIGGPGHPEVSKGLAVLELAEEGRVGGSEGGRESGWVRRL